MASIFSRIIAGEIPSYKVAEDDDYYAFLDIHPIVMGHTLVIPKIEVDYIYDLDDDVLAGLTVFSKRVAKALAKSVPCVRVGSTVMGLEVPHAHIHLLPFTKMSEMSFTNPKLQLSTEEFQSLADKIASHL